MKQVKYDFREAQYVLNRDYLTASATVLLEKVKARRAKMKFEKIHISPNGYIEVEKSKYERRKAYYETIRGTGLYPPDKKPEYERFYQ